MSSGQCEAIAAGPTGTSAEPANLSYCSPSNFMKQNEDDQLGDDAVVQDKYQPRNRTALITIARPEKEIMGDHKSYHQAITGEEAQQRLKRHGGSCYLTRYSENQKAYILSVYQEIPNDKMKHFKIKIEGGRYSIEGTEHAPFEELGELLSYYERKRIDPAFATIGTAYEEQQYLQDLEREKRERQERERQEREERERQEREERERQERERRERQERERGSWCIFI